MAKKSRVFNMCDAGMKSNRQPANRLRIRTNGRLQRNCNATNSRRQTKNTPKTRQSSKMLPYPYQRQDAVIGKLSPDRQYFITGFPEYFEVEREIVMKNKVDLNRTGWVGLQNLMHLALQVNDQELIKAIANPELSLMVNDDDYNDDTLWRAFHMDDLTLATKMIKANFDLNRRHRGSGATYLHWLVAKVEEKYLPLTLMLMDFGVDINATDKADNSVLHAAAEFGSKTIIKELLNRNVLIDVINKAKRSVIYAAASRNDCMEILPSLINCAKDTNTRNKRCVDAYLAMYDRRASIKEMKMIMEFGFPLDQFGRKGSTLLYEAVADKRLNIVLLLLENGADVNKKLRNGKLPLQAAAMHPDSTILKILLAKGANINECGDDYHEQYPIHAACKNLSLPNMKLLLGLGANVHEIDKNNRTPYSLVYSDNFSDAQACVIRYLAKSNIPMCRGDITKIRSNLATQDYYDKCIEDLLEGKELPD